MLFFVSRRAGIKRAAGHRGQRFTPNSLESLEPRTLLAAAYPTAAEQYLLELINRARLNPAAEAGRFDVELNEGLPSGTISSAIIQPLAMNPQLVATARKHSQWMIDQGRFSHTGAGGSDAGDRMDDAGYSAANWAENLAWYGKKLSTPSAQVAAAEVHRRLFIDQDINGRGHRVNLLDPQMKEVGVGLAGGTFDDFNARMATMDFAQAAGNSFLTGVAFRDDEVDDNFYTVGEGLGGVTVRAARSSDGRVFSTTTWASGGYSLALPAGTYAVSATRGGMAGTFNSTVNIGSQNVKRDFVDESDGGGGDEQAPTAKFSATKLKRVVKTYTFKVTYTDNELVDAGALGKGDVVVTGSKGFRQSARLVSRKPGKDAATVVATYRLTGPKGAWDKADNGKYAVRLASGEVSDVSGNTAAAKRLGTIRVGISAE